MKLREIIAEPKDLYYDDGAARFGTGPIAGWQESPEYGPLRDQFIALIPNLMAGAMRHMQDRNFYASSDKEADKKFENIQNYFGGDIRYPEGAGYDQLIKEVPEVMQFFGQRLSILKTSYDQFMKKHPEYENNNPMIKRLLILLNDGDIDPRLYKNLLQFMESRFRLTAWGERTT